MKPIAESGWASICLTCFLLRMVCNKKCFIAIALKLCFRERHYEGPGKQGWLEIMLHISF